jgi:hypothetical protein
MRDVSSQLKLLKEKNKTKMVKTLTRSVSRNASSPIAMLCELLIRKI